jgi:hypothetical protein
MIAATPPPEPPPKSCQFVAVKSARPQTTDPTSFEDDPAIVLAPGRYVALEDVTVRLRVGGRLVAVGATDRLSTSGGVVRLLAPPGATVLAVPAGRATVSVTGRRAAACPERAVRHRTRWSFASPTLAARAAPVTTFVEDARAGGLQLSLRSVAGRAVRGVRAVLLAKSGKAVAAAALPTALEGGAPLAVPVPAGLRAGRYTLRLRGRVVGTDGARSWSTPLVLGSRGAPGSPPVDQQAGLSEQRVVVDWSGGRSAGRDVAGFVAPGIGSGELVCAGDQQHVRFYPHDVGREQSMMLWTYKDWGGGNEKAIRESVHTQFTGPSFQEGLNKFSPPEKRSTGRYVGLISDRGALDAPFASGLAPATSIDLRWEWDFTDPDRARCHIEAVLRTENGDPGDARPLARTLQVVWRGDGNAAGHDRVAAEVPGVGTVRLTCEAGPPGDRSLDVEPAERGGSVTVRQGGDDTVTETGSGPLVVPLPNNGQVEVGLFGGASILVSSRWKVNDPKPGENSCRIAAQVVVR